MSRHQKVLHQLDHLPDAVAPMTRQIRYDAEVVPECPA